MTKKDKVYPVLTEKEIEQAVEEFRAWIAKNPEFPQDLGVWLLAKLKEVSVSSAHFKDFCICCLISTDTVLLVRYLNIFYYRMDKAQRLFKNAIEFRTKYPKVFIKRDPTSLEMSRVAELL